MYLILTASKDNYITNKAISNVSSSFSNVGQASTLDLFKLSSETFTPKISSTARLKFASTGITNGKILTLTDADNNTVVFKFNTSNNTSNGSTIDNSTNNINVGINDANASTSSLASRLADTINNVNVATQTGPSGNQELNITATAFSNGAIYLSQDKKGSIGDKSVSTDESSSKLEVSNFRMRENSKVLLGFDIDSTTNIFNINAVSNFSCHLKLFDVSSGHQKPKNADYVVRPLKKSFDEGLGKDTSYFSDYDTSNYLTSSYDSSTNSYNLWSIKGAEFTGLSNDSNADSINKHSDNTNLESTFSDESGDSNLNFNVTNSVTKMLNGGLSINEFLLQFTDSILYNDSTYFVKRLSSRHTRSKILKPQLHISFDDSITDSREDLYFNTSHSIYLENRQGGKLVNIPKDDTGADNPNPKLKLSYGGSVIGTFTSSKITSIKNQEETGIYKVTIQSTDISRFNNTSNIRSDINSSTSGSIKFSAEWYLDDTNDTSILKEDLIFKIPEASSPDRDIILREVVSSEYDDYILPNQSNKIFIDFIDIGKQHDSLKLPSRLKGINVGDVLYRVVDSNTKKTIINFHENGTKLSIKDNKYFFNFYGSPILKNRNIQFHFKLLSMESRIIKNNINFMVK